MTRIRTTSPHIISHTAALKFPLLLRHHVISQRADAADLHLYGVAGDHVAVGAYPVRSSLSWGSNTPIPELAAAESNSLSLDTSIDSNSGAKLKIEEAVAK